MTTAKKFLKVAASYIGTFGDYNIFNKWYWVDYTKAYNSDPGTAWCACFQSYVAMKTKLKCNYSASAAGFATQFERIPVAKEHTVKPGDIVIFNWDGRTDTGWADHVGVVEWSTIGQDGLFGTIEGNTGSGAEGVVARVTRNNNSRYFTAFYRPKYDAESSETSGSKSTAPSIKAKKLYGIDVSSNQPESICGDVLNDFGIVKMCGNPHGYSWNFVNPYAKEQAADTMKKNGNVGFYGFTYGLSDPTKEADLLVDNVKKLGYLGKAMLVIDYEADALMMGRDWVQRFAKRIEAKAGYKPVIYASGSVIVSQDLMSLGYPMWCANYSKGYSAIDGRNASGCKIYPGCEKSILWQFTSQGYIEGYDGPLDCNVFFGSSEDWKKYCGADAPAPVPETDIPDISPSGVKYVVTESQVNVREKRSVNSKLKGALKRGTKIYLDDLKRKSNGNIWGKITSRKYTGCYVAVYFKNENLLAKAKSVNKLAKEVIQGKWGDGDTRVKRLTEAGYNAVKVQARVDEILS